jgi:hypothetical protein
MRKPDSQEVRRQFADLFVVSTFNLAGLVIATLLLWSESVAQLLRTDRASDRHVLVSLAAGVGFAAVLTITRLWILTRRKKRGVDRVA